MLMITGLLVSCSSEAQEKEKNKDKTVVNNELASSSYGPVSVSVDEAISVNELLISHEGKKVAEEYTFEAEIVEVCSKAGCWVTIDKGDGETFMVRFKDHFTIPTDTKPGTKAVFHGVAMNDVIPVDMLRHFAEDAGKTEEEILKITEDKFDLNFTADGILILK